MDRHLKYFYEKILIYIIIKVRNTKQNVKRLTYPESIVIVVVKIKLITIAPDNAILQTYKFFINNC